MNEEILQRLEVRMETSEKKIDVIYESVKKIEKYFKWMVIVTIAFFVLPLIILVFAAPYIVDTYSNLYKGLL